MGLLETYSGKTARTNLIALYPELNAMIDVTGALLREQAAGGLDLLAYRKAANICESFRRVIGVLQQQQGDSFPVASAIAMARLKRNIRDASLIFPWPYTPPGFGTTIHLTNEANAALLRIMIYEPIMNYFPTVGPQYNGKSANTTGLLDDARILSTGFSLVRS